MVKLEEYIYRIFLYPIALLPFIGLFWDEGIGFLKVNWILYPIVLFSLISVVFVRNRISKLFIIFGCAGILYLFKALLSDVNPESAVRFFLSLTPLFFLSSISGAQNKTIRKKVIIIYCLSISFPIIYSILQYQGKVPFMVFDVVNGEVVGRTSGGYSKPNNFVAFLFPLYLLSFIVFEKKKWIGGGLLIFVLFLVYATGLRTTVIIYFIILVGYFFKKSTNRLVYNYYRYFVNFIIGTCFIIIIYIINKTYGQIDAFRGRLPTWEGHVSDFLSSKWWVILFGKGHTNLGDYYSPSWYTGSTVEPHNNSLRIIIIFGIAGFFFYSLLMRHFVMKALTQTRVQLNKFFISASFLFIMSYSITNEPAFYPAIFWIILFGVFFLPSQEKGDLKQE